MSIEEARGRILRAAHLPTKAGHDSSGCLRMPDGGCLHPFTGKQYLCDRCLVGDAIAAYGLAVHAEHAMLVRTMLIRPFRILLPDAFNDAMAEFEARIEGLGQ